MKGILFVATIAVALVAVGPAEAHTRTVPSCAEIGYPALTQIAYDRGREAAAAGQPGFVRPADYSIVACMAVDYNEGLGFELGRLGTVLGSLRRVPAAYRAAIRLAYRLGERAA